jgi:hypothetical protein
MNCRNVEKFSVPVDNLPKPKAPASEGARYKCKTEVHRMKINRSFLLVACLSLGWVSSLSAQAEKTGAPTTAPPKMLLLVHQQFQVGKAGARQKLEVESARAYDRLNVPVSWIDLQSISGAPEALFFDPLGSFEELDYGLAIK